MTVHDPPGRQRHGQRRGRRRRFTAVALVCLVAILLVLWCPFYLYRHLVIVHHVGSDNHSSPTRLIHSSSSSSSYHYNRSKTGIVGGQHHRPKQGRQQQQATPLSSVWIPPRVDSTVMNHWSRIWMERNGTEHLSLRTDRTLSRIRRTCPVTSQIRIEYPTTTTSTTTMDSPNVWMLYSIGPDGKDKTVGGDEYYITALVQQPTTDDDNGSTRRRTSVAHVTDLGDGSYSLRFVKTPFRRRIFSHVVEQQPTTNATLLCVELEYTCGVGSLPFGVKSEWRTGGALMVQYNATIPHFHQHHQEHSTMPESTAAAAGPLLVSHPFERPSSLHGLDFGVYERVLFYGDSNLELLVASNRHRFDNIAFTVKPQRPLTRRAANTRFLQDARRFLNQTLWELQQEQNSSNNKKRIAYVVGSSTWDIVFGVRHGRDYKDHLRGCEDLVRRLVDEYGRGGVVDVYWFSGLALHVHKARSLSDWESVEPLKYMSYSRSLDLYRKQMALMERLGVAVVDFFEASFLSAEFMPWGDARHYESGFYTSAMNWLYPHHQSTIMTKLP